MDLYRFFNSSDMEAHLRALGYEFRADEAAWVVWNSGTATWEEKREAYRFIINTLPDGSLRRRCYTDKSVHEFLREYMAAEEGLLARFRIDEPGAFYVYDVVTDVGEEAFRHAPGGPFSTLDRCLSVLPEDVYEDALRVCVEKRWIDEKTCIKATFSPTLELLAIRPWGELPGDGNVAAEGNLLFESLWFSFPTPFQRGDIVCESGKTRRCLSPQPMVLRGGAEVWDTMGERLSAQGDYTDMFAHTYCLVPETPGFDDDTCRVCLYDLEFYRGELTGVYRLLRAMSSLLKGDISPKAYTDAYLLVTAEARAASLRWMYDSYTPEVLGRLGLG